MCRDDVPIACIVVADSVSFEFDGNNSFSGYIQGKNVVVQNEPNGGGWVVSWVDTVKKARFDCFEDFANWIIRSENLE